MTPYCPECRQFVVPRDRKCSQCGCPLDPADLQHRHDVVLIVITTMLTFAVLVAIVRMF